MDDVGDDRPAVDIGEVVIAPLARAHGAVT
jgi:hypothetical protein